ncbi:MAG: HAD family hydrolase [Bacillota bacterium]|nr:HAD family hydrolase [Bacillota bacterium]
MKQAAIIFDFDDTLVQSYPIFLRYEALFIQELLEMQLGEESEIRHFMRKKDIALVTEAGYPAKDCFPRSFEETYRHFCRQQGRETDEEKAKALFQLGWSVHQAPMEAVLGAKELLEQLYEKLPLILFSQGEKSSQLERIQRSGFGDYFSHCRVVRLKTQESFLELLDSCSLDASSSWMIGNSLKSDIKPALAVGLNAIHFDTDDWIFDHAEVSGRYHKISQLSEIAEIIGI